MRVLVACEESQAVCTEFRKLGHEAYSCDILPESGGHPEWHIQDDVMNVLRHDIISPFTCEWDIVIAFPPCTHLAVSGAKHFAEKREDGRQQKAIMFFEFFTYLKNRFVAIENPVGIMNTIYRKPDQIIQPYYFGDKHQKTTCLWLKNLPPLYHNSEPNLFDSNVTHVDKGEFYEWTDKRTGLKKKMSMFHAQAKGFGGKQLSKDFGCTRSKTFPGIAKAMAEQWGKLI